MDILFEEASREIGIHTRSLRYSEAPLVGFTGEESHLLKCIDCHIVMGERLQQRTVWTTFVMVNTHTTYNNILGRPTLNQIGAVISLRHLKAKFHTLERAGVLQGNQFESLVCLIMLVKTQDQTCEIYRSALAGRACQVTNLLTNNLALPKNPKRKGADALPEGLTKQGRDFSSPKGSGFPFWESFSPLKPSPDGM